MHVAAVVVTFNRLELLLECLSAIAAQTRPVDRLVVVDNAASDETRAALQAQHPGVELHSLSENLGGAGGFAYGIAAVRSGADQIWLMDDDAAPRPDALEHLLAVRGRFRGETPRLVASRVVDHDGAPIPMNVPRRRPFASKADRAGAAAAGCMPIRSASFVSVLIDGDAARGNDLPLADYFIWNDDFEYTTRLLRDGVGLWCEASVVEHASVAGTDPGPRFVYEVRNKLWLLGRSSALNPLEKLVYGGATLRRWTLMIMRSRQRGVLLRSLGQGISQALRRSPRRTEEVLAGVTATIDQTTAKKRSRAPAATR